MKNVSFWCVVLAIVIIFFVHHILTSFKVVEGLDEQNQNGVSQQLGNSVNDSLSSSFNLGFQIGEGRELEDGEEIIVSEAGTIVSEAGTIVSEADTVVGEADTVVSDEKVEGEYIKYPGTLIFGRDIREFDIKRFNCMQGTNLDVQKKCRNTPECDGFVHTDVEGGGQGEGCLLHSLNPKDEKIPMRETTLINHPQAALYLHRHRKQDDFEYYPGISQTEGSEGSSLGCKGNRGGGGGSLTLQEAKDICSNTEDCGGFFHYNSNGSDRTCFKKNVNLSNGLKEISPSVMNTASSKNPPHEPGFHVYTGSK